MSDKQLFNIVMIGTCIKGFPYLSFQLLNKDRIGMKQIYSCHKCSKKRCVMISDSYVFIKFGYLVLMNERETLWK